MIIQKIKKNYKQLELAMAYYSVMSSLNNLQLQKREIELLAFIAVKGTIINPAAREEFCKVFKTTAATINNKITSLKKKGILVKDNKKIKINPSIALDFSQSIILQVFLNKTNEASK